MSDFGPEETPTAALAGTAHGIRISNPIRKAF